MYIYACNFVIDYFFCIDLHMEKQNTNFFISFELQHYFRFNTTIEHLFFKSINVTNTEGKHTMNFTDSEFSRIKFKKKIVTSCIDIHL